MYVTGIATIHGRKNCLDCRENGNKLEGKNRLYIVSVGMNPIKLIFEP